MNDLIYQGKTFNSYEEFQNTLDLYQERANAVFVRRNSRTVLNANKNLPADKQYNENLLYTNLTLFCKYGGEKRGKPTDPDRVFIR